MCVRTTPPKKNNFKNGSLPRQQVLFLDVINGLLKEMLVLDRDKKIGQSFIYWGLKEGTFIIGGEKGVADKRYRKKDWKGLQMVQMTFELWDKFGEPGKKLSQ